jgi:prepilin-type N-terminal cleavage/methylation domain-containing protein
MRRGFTLVELSIVLVIIGLIIGSVMVGKELIKAAEFRKTISQIQNYNIAVNTFRGKYDALPGDMPNASSFGFTASSSGLVNIDSNGNGDSIVYGVDGFGRQNAGNENLNFFRHLKEAGLTNDKVKCSSLADANLPCWGNHTAMWLGYNTPAIPLRPSGTGGIGIQSTQAINAASSSTYQLPSPHAYILNMASHTSNGYLFLKGHEGYAIDSKIDDGLPYSGKTLAYFLMHSPAPSVVYGANASCVTSAVYNVTNTTDSCTLWIAVEF